MKNYILSIVVINLIVIGCFAHVNLKEQLTKIGQKIQDEEKDFLKKAQDLNNDITKQEHDLKAIN